MMKSVHKVFQVIIMDDNVTKKGFGQHTIMNKIKSM